MSAVLTCPHGHQWNLPDEPPGGPGGLRLACPVCGTAVELQGAADGTRQSAPPADLQNYPSLPGYQIVAELGRGGMGIVYRAHDIKRQKLVALKTMQWVEPVALYRFKQEFRALAGLTHPNLITLYELISDGRNWFFTMELIDGQPFINHVRSAVSPVCEPTSLWTGAGGGSRQAQGLTRVQISCLRAALRQLISGILALHEAGKLHRDIKPGNVLVTRQGRVVLLDFGLAAELDRTGLHKSTEPHLLGTIAYMAPEQAAGQPLSPAGDWYAVGTMLYEALTGRLPFEGSALDVLMKKQSFDPPAPRTLVPEIPEDLDVLTVELLRRSPEARPSGREILQRLGGSAEDAVGRAAADYSGPASRAGSTGGLLIGRKKHLEDLANAFLVSRQGHTVVLHVHGRSGVGKSALVRHFLDGLIEREEAVVLAGRCYEQEAVPYKALDSLVDTLSRYLVRLSPLEAEALMPRDVLALARVFPVLRRVGAVAQAPRRALDLSDPQELRRRALAALRELLGRLGDRRPLVLFIDDLQWGDADSAALLSDLLRPPEAPTLLLLVGYRSEDAAANPCLRVLLRPPEPGQGLDCRELAVEPLTPEEGCDLVLTLLEETPPAARTRAEAIARESGGNPFFLYELVQHVQQTSSSLMGQQLAPAGDVTLHEVLWTRVLRLPEEARRFLEVVAVAGRPLPQTDACRAAGLGGEAFTALAHLRSSRFIRSAGPAERNEIETYHDRVRETVVAHLTPTTSREHHRGLAQVLEASGQSDPEFLASHFQGANELAPAGKYYALAAAQATDALAFDRAAKLYRLALEPRGALITEERTLRTCLGDALANAGRGAESAREYLVATGGASAAESLELQRRAALQLLISGHVDEGLVTLRAVLNAVGMKMPSTPRRAFWSLVLRRLQLRLRGLGFRLRAAGEVPPEELSRISICRSASVGLSMVDTIQGAYFQTRALLLALAAGEPNHLARELALEAGHVSIGGGHSRQRTGRLLQTAEALAQQVDQPYPLAIVSLVKGVAAAFEGNWRRALVLCDQAEGIFRGSCTGAVWELDTAHRFALWALMFMGEAAKLSRRLPSLLKEAQERDDLYAVTNLTLAVGTFARLAADEPERARSDIEQVMSRWSRQGFHVQHMNRLLDEAQIDLYLGQGRAAWDRLTASWPTLAASHFFRVQQVRVFLHYLRGRSALATAAGAADPRPFLRAAEQDARRLQRERIPWSEGLSRLIHAGVALIRSGPRAAELLREAVAALEEVDMALHAAAARRLLGQLVGGEEGQTLVAEADSWMRGQKIQNPARLAAMLVQGLPE